MEYMSVEDASKEWGLSPTRIKELCRLGRVRAQKLGKRAWLIERDQSNPKQIKGR